MLITDKDIVDNLNSESRKKPLSARCGSVLLKAVQKIKSLKAGDGLQETNGTISVSHNRTLSLDSSGKLGTAYRGVTGGSTFKEIVVNALNQWARNSSCPVPVRTRKSIMGGAGTGPEGEYEAFINFLRQPGSGISTRIGSVLAWDESGNFFVGSLTQPTSSYGFDNISLTWRKLVDTDSTGSYAPTLSQMNDSLRTLTSTSSTKSVTSGDTWSTELTFSIPSGWKYVGCLGTWSNGAIVNSYAIDNISYGATGKINLVLWSGNNWNSAVTYSLSCKILIQRIF